METSLTINTRRKLPILAISMGDPAGVGPEVTLKALADSEIAGLARYIVVGDAVTLEQAAAQTGLTRPDCIVKEAAQIPAQTPFCVLDVGQVDRAQFVPGKVSAMCGKAALEYIRAATLLCLDGQANAIVTGPVNKEAVTLSGEHFTGHTEYIAALCGVEEPRMLLVNDRLRVVHVTTHCGLREACESDTERVLRTIELGHAAMISLGLPRPRIAVCGLNPHAGENGLFGTEDRDTIAPAVQMARSQGIDAEGPFAADTLFFRAVQGAYDLVVAMYHDQGHIPMKLLDFANTVNVSLGLPIIRTSVDHGTAFDIVGKNQADPSSMKAALKLAATMAGNTEARLSEPATITS